MTSSGGRGQNWEVRRNWSLDGGKTMGVIKTIEGRCGMCFSCIRNCPVKAIKVENGQAMVIPDLCIYCGYCLEVCSQNAKCAVSGIDELKHILTSDSIKAACLAPSFVAEFTEIHPSQVVAALKQLGFDFVFEVALGAEMVAGKYKEEMSNLKGQPGYISTSCPSIIFLVEKYFPSLIPNLVPIVSPMVALGRYLKNMYQKNGIKVVFIGPCTSKKAEVQDERVAGAVDLALTFPELRTVLKENHIKPSQLKGEDFNNKPAGIAKVFPVSGGLIKSASLHADVLENRIITVDGRENCLEFFKSMEKGNISFDFVDILFCNGCINGPMYSEKRDKYKRLQRVKEYASSEITIDNEQEDFSALSKGINLNRSFANKSVLLPEPLDGEIQSVLFSLEKHNKADELNCGACGYETCREKAAAVVKGLAEKEMCLPYLIRKLEKNNSFLKSQLQETSGMGRFVGNSAPMQQVYNMIKKVAKTDTTILVLGESGTGKELAARSIHELSLRSDENYVSVNCAALPENLLESELFGHLKGSFTGAIGDKKGLFEEAHGGTIFLDEIGDISLSLQSKLLRVLQEGEFLRVGDTHTRKVDVRIIAATNKDLEKLIKEGLFRSDLYYRLNVIAIKMPALRNRMEDLPVISKSLLQKFSKKLGKPVGRFHPDAMELLLKGQWNGNVRELENIIERAVILTEYEEIRVEDLPVEVLNSGSTTKEAVLQPGFSLKEYLEECQRELIIGALEKTQGVQAQAAKLLGVNRSTLHEMIKRFKVPAQ